MMKSIPNLISYRHKVSQIFHHFISIFLARKLVSGISKNRINLASGARLLATWSPHVTPRLAAWAALALVRVRVKSQLRPGITCPKPLPCPSVVSSPRCPNPAAVSG
jgi:hypothetical protein